MKICTKCKVESNNFGPQKETRDGLHSQCRLCRNKQNKEHSRTKFGLVTKIYLRQKRSSKHRKHEMPSYTKTSLMSWLFAQKLFHDLYKNWKISGYKKSHTPSIDRLNNDKGYSFNNIKLVIWKENEQNGRNDMRAGKIIHGNKPQKAVIQYDLNSNKITEFRSISDASRRTNTPTSNISKCCKGNNSYSHAGGFIWKYKN